MSQIISFPEHAGKTIEFWAGDRPGRKDVYTSLGFDVVVATPITIPESGIVNVFGFGWYMIWVEDSSGRRQLIGTYYFTPTLDHWTPAKALAGKYAEFPYARNDADGPVYLLIGDDASGGTQDETNWVRLGYNSIIEWTEANASAGLFAPDRPFCRRSGKVYILQEAGIATQDPITSPTSWLPIPTTATSTDRQTVSESQTFALSQVAIPVALFTVSDTDKIESVDVEIVASFQAQPAGNIHIDLRPSDAPIEAGNLPLAGVIPPPRNTITSFVTSGFPSMTNVWSGFSPIPGTDGSHQATRRIVLNSRQSFAIPTANANVAAIDIGDSIVVSLADGSIQGSGIVTGLRISGVYTIVTVSRNAGSVPTDNTRTTVANITALGAFYPTAPSPVNGHYWVETGQTISLGGGALLDTIDGVFTLQDNDAPETILTAYEIAPSGSINIRLRITGDQLRTIRPDEAMDNSINLNVYGRLASGATNMTVNLAEVTIVRQ